MNDIMITIIIVAAIIAGCFMIRSCDWDGGEYRNNLNTIEGMKIPDSEKIALSHKLTDAYIAKHGEKK